AREVGMPGVVQRVGLEPLRAALAGDVEEGLVERVAGERQERDQADAGGPELPRLQRARTPAQQGLTTVRHAPPPGPRRARRRSFPVAREGETVTAAAHGLDRLERAVRIQLLAQAADEHFEHVRIAVEVLL